MIWLNSEESIVTEGISGEDAADAEVRAWRARTLLASELKSSRAVFLERKRGKYIRGTYMIADILRKGRWLAIHTEVIV